MSTKRVTSDIGLNIPASQYTNVESMAHEILIVPSNTTPLWNTQVNVDIREKNCLLHNLCLKFNVSAITGVTNAYYTPAWFWFHHIDLVVNGQTIDTIYGNQQFLQHQLFNFDEKRRFNNITAGDYTSVAQRKSLASASNDYYVPLWSFFKQTHMPLLYAKDDIQLRIFMDSASNNIVLPSGATGTPVSTFNNLQVLLNVSKLENYDVSYRLKELTRSVQSFQFNELRWGNYNINAGASTSSIVLTSIVGPVSFLKFVVRPVGVTGDNYFNYLPIKDFSILNAGSTNIVGGSAIPHTQALYILNRDWTRGSYSTEANVYIYSFGASPVDTITTGKIYNFYRFKGSEQLVLNFPTPLATAVSVDIYAYVNSAVQLSAGHTKKITL
jgi:hypothetical protein